MLRDLALRAKEYAFDALALGVVVATQLQVWTQDEHEHTRLAGLVLLAAGALLFRRVAPFASILVAAAGVIATTLYDAEAAYDTSTLFFVLLLGTWAAGSLRDERQAVVAVAALLAAGWAVTLREPGIPWTEALWISLPIGGLFVISSASARRAEQARLALARAREAEQAAQRAVADERSRITRELHDVLAHSVSVMTVQASAVRRQLKPEQEREREALLSVEETGRQALAEMRRLLGIMRPEDRAPLTPQPGLGTLPQLVDQVRESGLPVELTVEGTPVALPAGVDLSAYRIVQEALTNTMRHGGGSAHAWVAVRFGGEDLEIEVANDGTVDGIGGDGHGLVGMRERVAMCGGELESGPRPGGGFRISARIPVAGGTQ